MDTANAYYYTCILYIASIVMPTRHCKEFRYAFLLEFSSLVVEIFVLLQRKKIWNTKFKISSKWFAIIDGAFKGALCACNWIQFTSLVGIIVFTRHLSSVERAFDCIRCSSDTLFNLAVRSKCFKLQERLTVAAYCSWMEDKRTTWNGYKQDVKQIMHIADICSRYLKRQLITWESYGNSKIANPLWSEFLGSSMHCILYSSMQTTNFGAKPTGFNSFSPPNDQSVLKSSILRTRANKSISTIDQFHSKYFSHWST